MKSMTGNSQNGTKRPYRSAFTLIEVLVVIVIISILATIGTLTYQNVQRDANDTARDNAVRSISEALEKYYANNGEYPSIPSLVKETPANTGAVVAAKLSMKPADLLMVGMPEGETNPFTTDNTPVIGFIFYDAKGNSSCYNDIHGGCDSYVLRYAKQADSTLAAYESRYKGRGEVADLIQEKGSRMAAGYYHSLGLTTEGKVYAWGDNTYGQLGDETTSERHTPTTVSRTGALNGKIITAVKAGGYFSLGLSDTGQVFSWGDNAYGQLGDGSTTQRNTPVAVNTSGALAGKTVEAIAAGGSHSLALTSEGKVYAWGDNYYGQLGDGSTTQRNTPVAVNTSGALAGKTVEAIAAGGSHSLALTSEGKVYAWGDNYYGQLGDGSTSERHTPVIAGGNLSGVNVDSIAAGGYFSLARSADSKAYSWGQNTTGQLGDGTTTARTAPTSVNSSGVLNNQNLIDVEAGFDHAIAIGSDGRAFGWGYNCYGQLGDNSTTDRTTPVGVGNPF